MDEWQTFVMSLRDNPEEYTEYIRGYLLPMIEKKRRNGELTHVNDRKMTLSIHAYAIKGHYSGEVDENNKACGRGVWRSTYDTLSGTFYNDLPEGIIRHANPDYTREGEMRAGKVFGKNTNRRFPNQKWSNTVYGEDFKVLKYDYVTLEFAYYQSETTEEAANYYNDYPN